MFNLDLLTLEKELTDENYSKDKIVIIDLFWNKSSYVLKGNLIQEGAKTIALDISWYEMEKVNIETMKMLINSASDLNHSLSEFLEEKGFKVFNTNI